MSPNHIRGTLGSANQLILNVGILAALVFGIPLIDAPGGWRWMFGIGLIPPTLQFIGLFFCKETPQFLLSANKGAEAKDVLQKIYGRVDVNSEFEQMEQSYEESLKQGKAKCSELCKPAFLKPLVVGVGIMLVQQFTGINSVIYFSSNIFKSAGFDSTAMATLASILVAIANIIATCVALYLVDRKGRRVLLLVSLSGMAVFISLLGMTFAVPAVSTSSIKPVFSVTCTILYAIFFAFGTGPLPWVITSEIFSQRYRSMAVAIATASNWLSNFVIGQTFLPITTAIGIGETFWIFGGICILAVIFVALRVPETKGKSFDEIEKLFTK